MSTVQNVAERKRPKPGMGSVLSCVPAHFPTITSVDEFGTSICFTEIAFVPVYFSFNSFNPDVLFCSFIFRDLELAIPGSYVPNQPVIRISQVNSSLQVITSKQRPRKLCITGSNGKEYMFLLKGHEDLRQDERVMQLFSLVNTLLIHDPETFRRNLTIQVR